ncbi:Gfo/Idh/MocA family protein [Cognatishimia sp. F0-27]|uniref:Gfo/Idh/MocA family protein n=1 Tax=Cognatishimia sp. F0-27 TaxID=2816855 RepID=UPI001D0C7EBE|nr:Gfo/Idh/MocA family oxidoreductase [Cognatishimia sp. F0-27]MCC1491804.1 Gfo/Idh/MocA family oxidoreductase [Cognatishimia sp. F0-27]
MSKTGNPIPTGVALIGAGMIARTHVEALSAMGDAVRLVAIVSRNPDRARPLAGFYAGDAPVFTSDLAAVAADPEIDIAIVATPPSVREAVIGPLARAGKHILLEKPVARTVQEAEEVIGICDRAGVSLGVLFQHRKRAPSIAAARLVQSGTLGALGLVEIAVPLWRDQSYYDALGRGTYARDGGGVMLTNAIHSIDLALSLAGPVTRVQAMTATTVLHRMEAEDFAVAGLHFANGAVGSLIAGTAMFPHRTEVIRLHFQRASLRIDKTALTVDWRDGRQDVDEGPAMSPTGGKHVWHQAVIEDFIDALRTGKPPMVTGREAQRSHRVIEAIEASSRTGRTVDLPRNI